MLDMQIPQHAELADLSQQVTSNSPTTKPKNPKQLAACKAIPAKAKQTCEAQQKALAEACVIVANNQLKGQIGTPPQIVNSAADTSEIKSVLTTTQWLGVISICISVIRICYKHKENQNFLTKKPPETPPPVDVAPPVQKSGTRHINLKSYIQ